MLEKKKSLRQVEEEEEEEAETLRRKRAAMEEKHKRVYGEVPVNKNEPKRPDKRQHRS